MQSELERALCVVLRRDSVPLTVAGRTDAGVHALGQVASYEGEPAGPDVGSTRCCPTTWRCSSARPHRPDSTPAATPPAAPTSTGSSRGVPGARSSAGGRCTGPTRSTSDALRLCADRLVGTHDFTAFTPTETDHVRFERIVYRPHRGLSPAAGLLEFRIEADAFMRHMNRVLVGTMLEVGGGRRSVEEFGQLLDGRPRADAGATAPPHGLHFVGAGYGGQRVL